MPAWPGTLPASPLVDGYSDKLAENSIRTQMDHPLSKVRQRYTASIRDIPYGMILTTAQTVILDTFYETTLFNGSISFTHNDPRTQTTVNMRIKTPPSYQLITYNMWRTTLLIEIIP